MIAFAATHRLQQGASSPVTEEIDPNLALTSNDASPSRWKACRRDKGSAANL